MAIFQAAETATSLHESHQASDTSEDRSNSLRGAGRVSCHDRRRRSSSSRGKGGGTHSRLGRRNLHRRRVRLDGRDDGRFEEEKKTC